MDISYVVVSKTSVKTINITLKILMYRKYFMFEMQSQKPVKNCYLWKHKILLYLQAKNL